MARLTDAFIGSTRVGTERDRKAKARELLEHARGRAIIGDSGYDAASFADDIRRKGMKVVVPSQKTRLRRRRVDRRLYRRRYLVELFFHKLKRFRGIATRYQKTARTYHALVQVACVWPWINQGHPLWR